jgi:hypothetical protein
MSLKAILTTLDGLDEALRPLYKKTDDGKYALEVEGLTENRSKLEEFRATNRALSEKVEELQKQLDGFKGLDPVKYKELQDKMATLEEKRLLEDGKIDEVIHKRTERMRSEFQEQLQAKDKIIQNLEAERSKVYTERDNYIIDAELRRAVDNPEFGFQPKVADLLQKQVFSEFAYRDGKVVRVKPDGSLVYGKGGDPGTLMDFLQDVSKERPYLIRPSNGGGAPPNGGGGGGKNGKVVRRTEFEAATPDARMQLVKSGVQVVD